jgi:carboxyl-terminal processing protease
MSRPGVRFLPSPPAAVLVALLALGACAGYRPMPVDTGGQVFDYGLDQIGDLYIRPVSSRKLALSALARLSRLDDKFKLTELPASDNNPQIDLGYAGNDVAVYPEPVGEDAHQWGALIGRILADAKAASPALGADSAQDIDKALFDGITGMLDRYSRYASADVAGDQRAAREGCGAIGITLDTSTEAFRISAVAPDEPAALAGVLPEDRIVAVDGIATAGRPETEVIHQLRGPVDSAVEITVSRSDPAQERTFRLQRKHIVPPTVTASLEGGIAVYRIGSFNRDTTKQLAEDLRAAQAKPGLRGVVLDLRDNPGGLLDQAVSLAELFVAKGPIASTIGRHPASHQFFAATGNSVAASVPLAVLINGGSASSSEIVAAALQDLGRAIVIGTASYGKGTVQTVLHLPNEAELTLTWALLATPSGYLLQQHGVVPTVCTSDLKDDDPSLQTALRRVAAVAPPSRPRAALDDAAWSRLRQTCPPRPGDNPIDLKLATRVLVDPALYAQAVQAIAAAKLAAAPAALALTAAAGSLSSNATAH